MGRSAVAQGVSPCRKVSPARGAVVALPNQPTHPRNSREKLLTSTIESIASPRQRSPARSLSRRIQTNVSDIPDLFSYFSSHPACLFFIILGAFFFSGAVLSLINSWRGSSTSLSPNSPLVLSHLHAELIQIGNELKLKSKRQDTQTKEMTELKYDMGLLKNLKYQYQSIEEEMKRIEGSIEHMKVQFGSQLAEELAAITKKIKVNRHSLSLSESDTQKLNQLYRLYYLEPVERIDWARAAIGARVDARFTSQGINKDFRNTILSSVIPYLPLKYSHRSPPLSKPADIIIGGPEAAKLGFVQTDRLQPGYCFTFSGSTGNITILLPTVIEVSEIRIDHVAHEITPVIDSAPKSFAVYGDGCVTGSEEDAKEHSKGDEEANEKEASIRENESKTGKVKGETCWSRSTGTQPPSILLGQYKFDYPNHLSQTFEIEKKNVPTLRVRFEILNNHGNADLTSVYRLRIFGDRLERPGKRGEQNVPARDEQRETIPIEKTHSEL